MVWNNLVSQSAALARPRVLRTTFMCALSATVRFTSTIQEGQKIPTPPVGAQNPMVLITAAHDLPLFCRSLQPRRPQSPAFLHPKNCRAWPL